MRINHTRMIVSNLNSPLENLILIQNSDFYLTTLALNQVGLLLYYIIGFNLMYPGKGVHLVLYP